MPQFSYNNARVDEFKVRATDSDGNVTLMQVGDRCVQPTDRFWTSLCSSFSTVGLSKKLFKMFTHEEVFTRLRQTQSDPLRVTFAEYDEGKTVKMLAVTKPDKPVARYDDVINILNKYDGEKVQYQDGGTSGTSGIVQSWHTPPRMDNFEIGGDKFIPKYVMETPIDGFGKPLIYLSMLRQVCTNGMVGYSRAFRSELSLGKNEEVTHSLERALDSFSNEEGYMALRDRIEAARGSWASIAEAGNIGKTLSRLSGHFVDKGSSSMLNTIGNIKGWDGAGTADHLTIKIQKAFASQIGDLCQIYGIVHLDALSRRRMASMPCKATVYELMNFATEVATHYCDETGARALQADMGTLLGNGEYDLEGTREECPTFADWMVASDTEQEQFRTSQVEAHGEDLLN